jgi:catechol 2,3-dioxygenase-like lactoylglutathione lyase family enzyme
MASPVVTSTGLSHVVVRVSDLGRALAWYEAVLGYETLWNGHAPTPDRTRSAMGLICGGEVALELLETPAGKRRDTETLGVAGLSLTVPDVAAARAAFEASGLGAPSPVIPAQDWKVVFLFDPDGNVVELVEQPQDLASIAAFGPTLRARRDAKG